jgi:hypothetical protein
VTLHIRDFSRFLLTREDAKKIALAVPCPDAVDFSEIVSVSHCFADELFNRFAPNRPTVLDAPSFVEKVASAV